MDLSGVDAESGIPAQQRLRCLVDSTTHLASSGPGAPGGQQPEARPRGGQCPDSSTSTASKRHTARGCIAMSSKTAPCTQHARSIPASRLRLALTQAAADDTDYRLIMCCAA